MRRRDPSHALINTHATSTMTHAFSVVAPCAKDDPIGTAELVGDSLHREPSPLALPIRLQLLAQQAARLEILPIPRENQRQREGYPR